MEAAALARLLQVAAVASLNLGTALSVGAAALLDQQRQTCLRLLRIGLGLLLAGDLLLVWCEAATMADVPLTEAAGEILPVLKQSHFGHGWLVGLAALLSAAVLTATKSMGGKRWPFISALAVLVISRGSLSHLGSDGPSWAAVVDALHLAAMGIWAGIVFCGVVLLSRRRSIGSQLTSALLLRLSMIATGALGTVVLTGAAIAYMRLGGSLSAGLQSEYLRWLAVKLLLVATAAGLAAFNRFAVMPSLVATRRTHEHDEASTSRFAAVLRIEAVVLLGVLVLAALLATSAPPSGGA